MKEVYTGEYYEVLRYKGTSNLCIAHDGRIEPTTIEKIVNEIRSICIEAKERGYDNDEKWQIIKVEYTSIYSEDHVFVQSSQSKRVVAFYDNGDVIRF